jgi:hypothetical protein
MKFGFHRIRKFIGQLDNYLFYLVKLVSRINENVLGLQTLIKHGSNNLRYR